MDNMNNEIVDNSIDTLATEVTESTQTEDIATNATKLTNKEEVVETEEMFTKAQMQKHHSEKMNGFLKRLGANSIDEVLTRQESLETKLGDMTKENESLRQSILHIEEKEFLKEVGVTDEVKDDFKLLFDKRMGESPESDKVDVAKEIVSKYFAPKPEKIGVEQKTLDTDINPGLSQAVLNKYGLK